MVRVIAFHWLWSGAVMALVALHPMTEPREVIISWLGIMAIIAVSIAVMSTFDDQR